MDNGEQPKAGRAATRPKQPALVLAVLLGLAAAAAPFAQTAPDATPPANLPSHPAPKPPAAAGKAAGTAPLPRPAPRPAEAADPEAETVFAMPRIAEDLRIALGLAAAGDLETAGILLDGLATRHPDIGPLQAHRAVLATLRGEPDAALDALERAVELGLPDPRAVLGDPVFAPLGGDGPRAARLAALAGADPLPPVPAEPEPAFNGIAHVSGANTRWNPARERLEPLFAFRDEPVSRDILPPTPKEPARELLREHWRGGRVAGNHGDLYDNRDRGHSELAPAVFPQVTRVTYSAAARAADIDYALNDRILFDRPTFGNSSTALTGGPHWRSLPRLALTRADGTGPMRLWQNWAANHIYVHPAHRDYGREAGDLFPANTPYLLVSRGSSGSDKPFLEALATILASFRPDTKAKLVAENLLAPTVQMVFRRSLQNVRSRESYFSGDAHPAAFEGANINLARMVSLAHSIRADRVPAEARIAAVEEELGEEGVDFFGEGLSEQLFDTPSAIARIWRSTTGRRSMVLSAEASRDANDRPLTFHWRLLQGDPDRVRIEPLDGGRRARVTLDWHDPFTISEENPQRTSRVDIAVFADNGAHDSAPAILSWYFPPNETRRYEDGPGGAPRILQVDYGEKAGTYADPLLLPRAGWRDVYAYDAEGRPAGWQRFRDGAAPTGFTPGGERILTAEAAGEPDRTVPVVYGLAPQADGTIAVEERDAELPF